MDFLEPKQFCIIQEKNFLMENINNYFLNLNRNVSNNNNFYFQSLSTAKLNKTTISSYEVNLLKQATSYFVQVEAIDAKGRAGPSVPPLSKPLTFTTNPAPVASVKESLLFLTFSFEISLYDLLINLRDVG